MFLPLNENRDDSPRIDASACFLVCRFDVGSIAGVEEDSAIVIVAVNGMEFSELLSCHNNDVGDTHLNS